MEEPTAAKEACQAVAVHRNEYRTRCTCNSTGGAAIKWRVETMWGESPNTLSTKYLPESPDVHWPASSSLRRHPIKAPSEEPHAQGGLTAQNSDACDGSADERRPRSPYHVKDVRDEPADDSRDGDD